MDAHDFIKTCLLKNELFYLYQGLMSALMHPETAKMFKGPVYLCHGLMSALMHPLWWQRNRVDQGEEYLDQDCLVWLKSDIKRLQQTVKTSERITGPLPNLQDLYTSRVRKIILDSTHPDHLPLQTVAFWSALAFWQSMRYSWLYVPVG